MKFLLPLPAPRCLVPVLLACCLTQALGQDTPPAPQPAPTPCPAATAVTLVDMLGLWRAEFSGLWEGATLLIEPHPRYAESFAGGINRNGVRGRIAGDIENGELTLEESADGVRISATWTGEVVEGSCGREIRGTWRAEGDATGRAFVLRKQAQSS